jgi:hypothetical protein
MYILRRLLLLSCRYNQIALWVTDCILEKEDSRKRAAVLKQFINVADVGHLYSGYDQNSQTLPAAVPFPS